MGIGIEVVCAGVDDGDAPIETRADATVRIQAGGDDGVSDASGCGASGAEASEANGERGGSQARGETLRHVGVRWLPLAGYGWKWGLGVGWSGTGSALRAA